MANKMEEKSLIMHSQPSTQNNNTVSSDVIGSLSILVSSCDAYADLWRPFFSLFWKYWGDCPFKVFLGTNTLTFSHPQVTSLHSDKGLSWADNFRDYLDAIETTHLLMMLDDFFLKQRVKTDIVIEAISLAHELEAHCVRLFPQPPPTVRVFGVKNFGILEVGSPYRVSTQAAIWRKDSLLRLLRPGESIWEFEVKGSIRSMVWQNGFYGFYMPVIPYGHHVVEKGKWFLWEARRYGKMNIGCDLSARGTMTPSETMKWCARKILYFVLEQLPWRTYLNLMARLGNLKKALTKLPC
jgi:hypothetical protein